MHQKYNESPLFSVLFQYSLRVELPGLLWRQRNIACHTDSTIDVGLDMDHEDFIVACLQTQVFSFSKTKVNLSAGKSNMELYTSISS